MEIKGGFVRICLYFSALAAKINGDLMRIRKISIYFSALAAKINAKCAFKFPLLGRHFKGTLNGNTAHGVYREIRFFMFSIIACLYFKNIPFLSRPESECT